MKTMNTAVILAALFAVPALHAEDALGDAIGVSTAAVARPQPGLVAGYRGTPLPVPGDQLLYVKKGDRVDLLVTFEAIMNDGGKERKEMTTATILQNVIVINVLKADKPEGAGAIELLLNPNEAQYAALSVARGKAINITVRAPGDVELHPMEMASFRRLIK
ncbi:MAG TPA: hypothetical protein DCZ92_07380 [Elusimicrobia bacterium]|nr:MAG: hypothetical protein A2016_03735 [Elusimicrobia bacterium GWF2_62_30]HBA60628.1 hypothetical protein [Elusimicrobiota bacterium]